MMKLGLIVPMVLLAWTQSCPSLAAEYRVEVVLVSLPADFSVERIARLDVAALQGSKVAAAQDRGEVKSRLNPPPARAAGRDGADSAQRSRASVAAALAAQETLRDVIILSRPVLTVVAGRSAEITVGSSQVFEYMQPDETEQDRFIKKTTEPKELGFSMTLTVEDAGDGWVMMKEFAASQTSLVRRRAVQGLKLDCGQPVFASHSIASDFSLRLGNTYVLPFPVVSDRMPVVLVRVNRLGR